MKIEIESAIKKLVEMIVEGVKPDDALKLTQSALNLAHTRATLAGANNLEKDK